MLDLLLVAAIFFYIVIRKERITKEDQIQKNLLIANLIAMRFNDDAGSKKSFSLSAPSPGEDKETAVKRQQYTARLEALREVKSK